MSEEGKQPQQDDQKQEPKDEGLVEKTEKWWDATRKTLNQAGHKATQYKQIVQKKIDLASIHKKIGHAHADLGKLVDEAHETEETDILAREDIRQLLEKLDNLKQTAATLEHEIEMIKAESSAGEHAEKAQGDGQDQPKTH